MPLSAGSRLGVYEIQSALGAGGMGEVYRARDTKLGRDVALKIVRESVSSDPVHRARFQREAQILAALNHPNIAAIYGFEESSGTQALVLELVEGETLADRIAARRLPLDEVLRIARQIAEALEAAHEQGVTHRDLKPVNIKLRPSGVVKVLDFGLAKMMDTAQRFGNHGPDSSSSTFATITAPAMRTDAGVVLGTAAYMSPEQVRGQAVDKRTDIWAFGCVLYEMLTGRRAFGGDTPSDSLANTLQREPDWTALPPSVRAPIRTLLARCLDKDPVNRLHDIADARLEIVDALSSTGLQDSSPGPNGGLRRARIAVPAVGVAAALAAGWLIGAFASRGVSTGQVGVVEIPLTLPENIVPGFGIAVSPDGDRIAIGIFGAGPEIWLRSLDSSDIRPMPGSKGEAGRSGRRTDEASASSPMAS
jgi:serine/threonine protein kinase